MEADSYLSYLNPILANCFRNINNKSLLRGQKLEKQSGRENVCEYMVFFNYICIGTVRFEKMELLIPCSDAVPGL